jgi:hypothetical protein
LNWGLLAQVKVGAPANLFADECMAELAVETDPYGKECLCRQWPQIELVAEMLIRKDRLSESEALSLLEIHRLDPLRDMAREAAALISARPRPLH